MTENHLCHSLIVWMAAAIITISITNMVVDLFAAKFEGDNKVLTIAHTCTKWELEEMKQKLNGVKKK